MDRFQGRALLRDLSRAEVCAIFRIVGKPANEEVLWHLLRDLDACRGQIRSDLDAGRPSFAPPQYLLDGVKRTHPAYRFMLDRLEWEERQDKQDEADEREVEQEMGLKPSEKGRA